ncbi:hypothetical protein CDL15_Pgr001537 [Punica granatum]|nr:hypothetical protein CDL15_Pgr001537 [Punica granatum]
MRPSVTVFMKSLEVIWLTLKTFLPPPRDEGAATTSEGAGVASEGFCALFLVLEMAEEMREKEKN